MPKGYALSERQKNAIYTAYTMGEKQADIAAQYGIATKTVSKIVNQQRREVGMAAREKVVAGDKRNGRLTSTTDPHRFEGTCVINGRAKSRMFTAVNAKNATDQWERWCQEQRDEQAFMDMVERTPRHEADEHDVEYQTETVVSAPEEPLVIDMSDQPAPDVVTTGILGVTPVKVVTRSATLEDTPVYVVYVEGGKPMKVFTDMERAMCKVDELNEALEFAGVAQRFTVDECRFG